MSSASSIGSQMATPGSLYSSHGPPNLPKLRYRSGPENTDDPGSCPGQKTSSTPSSTRALEQHPTLRRQHPPTGKAVTSTTC
eukprot:2597289-Lingulodinium_polyedra.AAC.1